MHLEYLINVISVSLSLNSRISNVEVQFKCNTAADMLIFLFDKMFQLQSFQFFMLICTFETKMELNLMDLIFVLRNRVGFYGDICIGRR